MLPDGLSRSYYAAARALLRYPCQAVDAAAFYAALRARVLKLFFEPARRSAGRVFVAVLDDSARAAHDFELRRLRHRHVATCRACPRRVRRWYVVDLDAFAARRRGDPVP